MDNVYVKRLVGYSATFANKNIKKRETVLVFKGRIINKPTRLSLQIDKNMHLSRSGEVDDNVNHSCDPTCYADFSSEPRLVALRDIEKDEEVTWDLYHRIQLVQQIQVQMRISKVFRLYKRFQIFIGRTET